MLRPIHTPLVLLLVAVPCRSALADVLHVPHDYDTIQEAADAAVDGDTIAISGGVYDEAVVVSNLSDVRILAKGKVVIDPPNVAAGLTVQNCTDVDVIKVRVSGATDGIVFSGCTGGSLQKCRVEDVSGSGIVIDDSQFVLVEKCRVENTGGHGVSLGPTLPSDDCNLLLNTIISPGDAGFDVSGDWNSLESNRVLDAAGDGFRTAAVPVAANNEMALNKVIHAGGNGFVIGGDDNELWVNKAIQPAGHGFQLVSGTGHVVGFCKAIKPGQDGVLGDATAVQVSVFNSSFKKPGADGVVVGGDNSFVTKCKIAAAGVNGCVVGGDSGYWMGNHATGSGDDGFQMEGTGNTLTKNKAHGSHGGYDLNDLAGGDNTIDETNKFKTWSP